MNKNGKSSPETLRHLINAKELEIKALDDGINELVDAMKMVPSEKRVVHSALWNRCWDLRIEHENISNKLAALKVRLREAEKKGAVTQ
ncbi:hypothetical protein ACF3MZ_21405 [Paenibacillaceae bacterium WGS1546]|uniref:hypothetical protein n=1 Tax=Cohnella sp. WGS1546 TaxID=3366810 RepID=UPI00372D0985